MQKLPVQMRHLGATASTNLGEPATIAAVMALHTLCHWVLTSKQACARSAKFKARAPCEAPFGPAVARFGQAEPPRVIHRNGTLSNNRLCSCVFGNEGARLWCTIMMSIIIMVIINIWQRDPQE